MANKYAQHSKAKEAFNQVHHRPDWVRGCGSKVRYVSARNAATVARKCLQERHIHLNHYHCRQCGGWHLTKKGANND